MDAHALARYLEDHAARLGLEWIGVAPPEVPARDAAAYRRWLEAGHHGEMAYMARPDAVARRERLEETLAGVRSVAVVAEPYPAHDPPGIPDDPSLGVIARYARGRDYHTVLLRKLQAMARGLPEEVTARPYVDTGPLLERALGRMAGLGWQGRNTMLIHPRRGSYFFLGSLLVDAEVGGASEAGGGSSGGLPGGEIRDHCGTCRACLDACPTGALLGRDETGAPVMDARRCISYLTIEQTGPIPEELRPLLGNRVFGCDICQEVCPWNERFAAEAGEPGYAARGPGERPVGVEALPGEDVSAETHPGTRAPSLVDLMQMTREDWDAFTRGSAIRRAGYAGFRRNVAVATGNWLAGLDGEGPEEAVAVLREALEDESELVREHAAWALGQI
jgi:epoxyqueuosine reductase